MKKHEKRILNSFSYLELIRKSKPQFKCRANELILHLGLDGKIESCSGKIGSINDDLAELWRGWIHKARKLRDCNGCLFSGYVELSLFFNLNFEVIKNYLRVLK